MPAKKPVSFAVPLHAEVDLFAAVRSYGQEYCLMVSLCFEGQSVGALLLERPPTQPFLPDDHRLAEVCGQFMSLSLAFGEQTRELDRLVHLLEGENRLLHARAGAGIDARDLLTVCRSPAIAQVNQLARQVARSSSPVARSRT